MREKEGQLTLLFLSLYVLLGMGKKTWYFYENERAAVLTGKQAGGR